MLTTHLEKRSNFRLISAMMGMQMRESCEQLIRLLGVNRPAPLSEQDLALPDSDIAVQANEHAMAVLDGFTYGHSMRSFLFGMAIGKHAALPVDREVLFLAAIMHDLGLCSTYHRQGDFELNGAAAAHRFLSERAYSQEKADRVHEAIALHSSVGIADKKEPETRLVHFGAGVDVLGIQRQNIAPVTLNWILGSHPRKDFVRQFTALLENEAGEQPGCHIAGLVRLGFAGKMKANPVGKCRE
jgi:cyanamide hydratase family protein with HD domain